MPGQSPRPTPVVSYHAAGEAWAGWNEFIQSIIRRERPQTVCEVGGGRNPTLSADVVERSGFQYVVLDISQAELDLVDQRFATIAADIAAPDFTPARQFDLVISHMLAEHVADGSQFHSNILQLLRPGGVAVHFFPTLYTAPFLANRILPERISQTLLRRFAPRDEVRHAKFPAYYSWCRGPTHLQLRRIAAVGFAVEEYRGFFGHTYYGRIPLLRNFHASKTRLLLARPIPQLTSYAYLVVRKPLGRGEETATA